MFSPSVLRAVALAALLGASDAFMSPALALRPTGRASVQSAASSLKMVATPERAERELIMPRGTGVDVYGVTENKQGNVWVPQVQPSTLNPTPSTHDPQPSTLNTEHSTLDSARGRGATGRTRACAR